MLNLLESLLWKRFLADLEPAFEGSLLVIQYFGVDNAGVSGPTPCHISAPSSQLTDAVRFDGRIHLCNPNPLLLFHVRHEVLHPFSRLLFAPCLGLLSSIHQRLVFEMLVDAVSCQLREGHAWFLSFCIGFHLLDVRFLLHSAHFIVFALISEPFIDTSLAKAHIFCFSHFLEGRIFSQDVVVSGETTFLHRLEDILLVEIEHRLFQVVLML